MAGVVKKVDKIRQIVRLKQLMRRWKHLSLRGHSPECESPRRQPPSGFLFVYVGPERRRFAIPARFVNLPVFATLLDVTEEEFGLRSQEGGLVLLCQVDLFVGIVKCLHRDEHKYGKLSLEDFVNLLSVTPASDSCKDNVVVLTPLLQKAAEV